MIQLLGGVIFSRWGQITIAVLLTAIVVGSWQRYEGYSKEHKKLLEMQQHYLGIIELGELRSKRLSDKLDAAIKESTQALKEKDALLLTKEKELQKRIKENAELKRIIIPVSAARLHNESVGEPPTGTSPRIQDETKPGTNETTGTTRADSALLDLGTFLGVVVSNNLKHLSCISQVEGLQKVVCELYAADGQPLEYETCQASQ